MGCLIDCDFEYLLSKPNKFSDNKLQFYKTALQNLQSDASALCIYYSPELKSFLANMTATELLDNFGKYFYLIQGFLILAREIWPIGS